MSASRVRLDLLRWKPLRAAAMRPWFPVAFQAAALAAVAGLVAAGFGVGAGLRGEELLTLRKTNLSTLVVWGVWWPGMIAVALAFGRVWCTICPMELVNRAGDEAARRAGWRRAPLGRFLRAGWMVVAGYLVLQLLVAGMSVHRMPHYTAVLLMVLVGAALAAGLVFREPRSFCRAFCPAGALLSVYGRQTPFQLEVRDESVCAGCRTRDCVREENRHRLDGRSCPSLLRPFDRGPSDGCVMCLQCAKVCPHDNVGVGLVDGAAPIRRRTLLRPFEAAFVMVALGFVSHEVVGEVKWLDGAFHTVPDAVAKLAPSLPPGWFEAAWFLVAFPMGIWALVAAAGYASGHRAGVKTLLLAAATGAAPVVAVAHVAKAAAKLSSWGGYLPLALRDPRGLETARRISEHSLAAPASFAGLSVVGWAALALVALVAWKTRHWLRQIPAESAAASRAGAAGAAVLFTAVLVVWSWPGR